MKKIGITILLVVLSVLLISSFVFAQENEKVKKAYSCLEDKVKDKCGDLSVEEQAFTVLAIGKCSSELKDKSKEEECWPSGGCRLRDTALTVLALDRIGKSTTKAEDWLLNQKKISKDLIWYLEIDSDEETECDINYDNTKKTITIKEDKKIDKPAGSCLPLATEYDNYWLKIDDDCYAINFTISCDKDFKTTLLYKKKTGDTIYVSSKTNSASAEGKTEERVNAFCFNQAGCNYEGSLWATLALAKTGHDVSQFLPYLIAMEDENEKFFPSAFLYIITDYDEYFTKIIDKANNYWKIKDSPYHQFYDTALALLALYGLDAEQVDNAKTYLLEVQGDNGCWNTIRDTAFILYAAFPKAVSVVNGDMDDCEDYGYYCTSPLDCSQNDVLENYVCYGGKVCCKKQPAEKTCAEKDGTECGEGYRCLGATVPASDTTKCCVGTCEKLPEKSECEKENYVCRYSCLDDEEEKIYDCEEGKKCCAPKPIPERDYWWIWLLVILIILLIIAIIFRNQLRIWLFRIKSKFRRGPAPVRARPGFPPPPGTMPRARPRMIIPQRPVPIRRPPAKAVSKTDKELEETLKKLKERSK